MTTYHQIRGTTFDEDGFIQSGPYAHLAVERRGDGWFSSDSGGPLKLIEVLVTPDLSSTHIVDAWAGGWTFSPDAGEMDRIGWAS